MDPHESPLDQPAIRVYLACYALYAIVLVLCYYTFWIWRSTMEALVHLMLPRSETFSFWYLLATILIGFVLFGVAIGSESYLREGVQLHRLRNRFTRVAGQIVVAILVAFALQEVLYRAV